MTDIIYNTLHYSVPERVRHSFPEGINFFKFEGKDILLVWFQNNILIFDADIGEFINGSKSLTSCRTTVLSVEGIIVDILQLGEVIGVFNGKSLYLLIRKASKSILEEFHANQCNCPEECFVVPANFSFVSPSRTSQESSISNSSELLDLKVRMNIYQVLAIGALPLGFVLIKKEKSEKVYVDIYETDQRIISAKKKFSIELPYFTYTEGSCLFLAVQKTELDPEFARVLLEEFTEITNQVIFVCVGSNQVYCIPFLIDAKPVPKLLYNSTLPIKKIVCFKDPNTALYAHVGVILNGGPLMFISSNKQKLYYKILYLPGGMESCLTKYGILTADGMDIWYSKLTWSKEKQPFMESKKLGVKGISCICSVPDSDLFIGITLHLTLYCFELKYDEKQEQPKKFTIPHNIMANIDAKMQYLSELKWQIGAEEKAMEALSISMRDDLLRDTFSIFVQVLNSDKGSDFHHSILEVGITNLIEQDYSPDIWQLQIYISNEGTQIMETSKLSQRLRKGLCMKKLVKVDIEEPFNPIHVSCYLIAKISEEKQFEHTSWAMIPIASTVIDISHFFSPSMQYKKESLSENLSSILYNYMNRNVKSVDWKQCIESAEQTCMYRLLNGDTSACIIWKAIIKNCRHRYIDIPTEKELCLFVGCHSLKLVLNDNCSMMQLKTKNPQLMQSVKRCLVQLLKETSTCELIPINRSILSKAKKLKADLLCDESNLMSTKKYWEETVTRYLPL